MAWFLIQLTQLYILTSSSTNDSTGFLEAMMLFTRKTNSQKFVFTDNLQKKKKNPLWITATFTEYYYTLNSAVFPELFKLLRLDTT
jgi:glycine cleavage system pyridoxal-binding protein P